MDTPQAGAFQEDGIFSQAIQRQGGPIPSTHSLSLVTSGTAGRGPGAPSELFLGVQTRSAANPSFPSFSLEKSRSAANPTPDSASSPDPSWNFIRLIHFLIHFLIHLIHFLIHSLQPLEHLEPTQCPVPGASQTSPSPAPASLPFFPTWSFAHPAFPGSAAFPRAGMALLGEARATGILQLAADAAGAVAAAGFSHPCCRAQPLECHRIPRAIPQNSKCSLGSEVI